MTRSFVVPSFQKYAPVEIDLPIDWSINPYGSVLWSHHFLSLRWALLATERHTDGKANPLAVVIEIVNDFLFYHHKSLRPISQFYAGRVADHTCAERLSTLQRIVEKVQGSDLEQKLDWRLIKLEIHFLVKLLRSDIIYRPKSNHGLMIDLSLLDLGTRRPDLCPGPGTVEAAARRARQQLRSIFGNDGGTLEHSVSYQEYNLDICARLAQSLDRLVESCGSTQVDDLVRQLREETYEVLHAGLDFLGGALKPTLEYSCLGDTFRRPDQQRLDRICSIVGDRSHSLRMQLSGEGDRPFHGVRIFWEAGFAFIRHSLSNDPLEDLHIGITCCFHSHIHKQNDDSSFTLCAFGRNIVEDPGYYGAASDNRHMRALMVDAAHHNLLTVDKYEWPRALRHGGSRFIGAVETADVLGVVCEHRQIEDCTIRRYLMVVRGAFVVIVDQIRSSMERRFLQHFTFGNGVSASSEPGVLRLTVDPGILVAELQPPRGQDIRVTLGKSVLFHDSSETTEAHAVDFGALGRSFDLVSVFRICGAAGPDAVEEVSMSAENVLGITFGNGEVVSCSFRDRDGGMMAF